MISPVLAIRNLVVSLGERDARIIDDVSLEVRERETLCLVGESGSGKSVTSLTVMGLLQKGSLTPGAGIEIGVGAQHLVDLAADRHHRIERGHRLLEDHRHGGSAQLP